MPIKYDSNNPRLIPSVVSFIDVLGFSQLGMRAINNGEGDLFLNQIHTSLNKARHAITNQMSLAKVKVFTDNVVIGWPIYGDGEGELGTTFLYLAEYQFLLTLDGFFIRGGVSVGDHFMDEETVFGPELITAYDLESQVAVYPRIILSENVNKKCMNIYLMTLDLIIPLILYYLRIWMENGFKLLIYLIRMAQ